MRFRYSQSHLDFLRATYPSMGLADLTRAFNTEFGESKDLGQIHAALKNHKITCGRSRGELTKGRLLAYTHEQAQWLAEQYKSQPVSELVSAFNARFETDKTFGQILAFIKNHKVKSGRTGRFKKGMEPWNAGTKGVMKPNSGSFKKGSTPPNQKPLWSERICSKDGYVLMKVPEQNPHTGAPTRFKHKHLWVWEQEHGPVPEGMVVSFVDGDKLNCDPSNLELLNRSDLAVINQLGGNAIPPEFKEAAKLLAKVHSKKRERIERAANSD